MSLILRYDRYQVIIVTLLRGILFILPNFNIYFDFAVPGVIPLTIMDAQSVHAEIMSLVIDPRLTTVLRLRQEGVATRATASLSSLAAEEPIVPAQTSPLTRSGPEPSASTQADQPEQALPPDPPTAEVNNLALTPEASTGWWTEQWLAWEGILCQ